MEERELPEFRSKTAHERGGLAIYHSKAKVGLSWNLGDNLTALAGLEDLRPSVCVRPDPSCLAGEITAEQIAADLPAAPRCPLAYV